MDHWLFFCLFLSLSLSLSFSRILVLSFFSKKPNIVLISTFFFLLLAIITLLSLGKTHHQIEGKRRKTNQNTQVFRYCNCAHVPLRGEKKENGKTVYKQRTLQSISLSFYSSVVHYPNLLFIVLYPQERLQKYFSKRVAFLVCFRYFFFSKY